MTIATREFFTNGLSYSIRSATVRDAEQLSEVRVRIDGETENLDREKGEGFISAEGFRELIRRDTENARNLFLVADVGGKIVGFSRCEGSALKRFSHKVEFGICILADYWGYRIGYNLLNESVFWADANGIQRIELRVLESNEKAIRLYKKLGFEIEGVLRRDKLLSDGNYYNTIIMGRIGQ